MSSRQLRKLQQQRELERARLQAEEEEASSESEEGTAFLQPTKAKPSLFANLASLEDEDEENLSVGEKEDVIESLQDDLNDLERNPVIPPKRSKKSSKKKRKTKNKGKDSAKSGESQKQEDGLDDIDAVLEELNLRKPNHRVPDESIRSPVDPHYEKVCALLGVNNHNLKVSNEMRSIFGRESVENHDDAGGPIPRGGRRRQRGPQQIDLETALRGHHPPGKGLSELTLRRNIFIQGKEDWPRATTGGLTMGAVDDQPHSDGTVEFRFIHDQAYQRVQQEFDIFVEMGDPQNLIGLLQRNPYHVSLLIQVSKIAKDQSDHSLSADLLERSLFTFGRASQSLFATKLSEGKARLNFARPENRELWLAGYQYIKSLVMKGTYRTAFEWAKLLLSLDPEDDPYCMRLMIHHLALRAHQFSWLSDFDIIRYSYWNSSFISPSLAFAAMQLKDGARCRELLERSMKEIPWVFCHLFKELSLDPPQSIWGEEPRTDAENLFSGIYVRQTKDLWNTPEATSLLMEIAHAIGKVDLSPIRQVDNSEITLDVARFVYLDNTPALMALVPSSLLHRRNNSDADPLPPDYNSYSYESQRSHLESRGGSREDSAFGEDFFDPLAAMMRLVPGFGRNDNTEEENEALRQRLEDVAIEEEAEMDQGEGDERQIGVSLARRLLNMLWRSGDTPESESPAEPTEAEGQNEYDNEDD